MDKNRTNSPLKKVKDAISIRTDILNKKMMVKKMIHEVVQNQTQEQKIKIMIPHQQANLQKWNQRVKSQKHHFVDEVALL